MQGFMQGRIPMTSINFHFIDARGALIDHRNWLHTRLLETYEKVITLMPLRPLDVIVKAGTHVIPEKGHLGYAPEPGLIFLTVDPASDIFRANQEASLERMFAHELHHAARWDAGSAWLQPRQGHGHGHHAARCDADPRRQHPICQ